jgi:ABC-type glycerol-3-phosphate transport system permease component
MTLTRKTRRVLRIAVAYLLLTVGAVFFALPFIWTFLSSFKSEAQIFKVPMEWIPRPFLVSNYVESWKAQPFLLYYKNSIVITGGNMLGTALTCTLAAFGFSRLRFFGKRIIFMAIIGTMILPYQVTIIPRFLLFKSLGLLNTPWPLILPAFGAPPFFVFLMRQFLATIPAELDDAATIDGCGTFGILWRILLPVSKPALTSVAIFTFMNTWNDFFNPLLYISSRSKFTITLGLMRFRNDFYVDWSYLMAASVIAILPCLIIFFLLQKYFVQGIALTGLKG